MAAKVKEVEAQFKDEAETEGPRAVIATAIQRCAADHVERDRPFPSFTLPNDEMKGRIIGREGRNIRTHRDADRRAILIIDDTPGGHHALQL